MKVEWRPTEWCPVGQFVITAENIGEELILDKFSAFGMPAKSDWKFCLHGRYSCNLNVNGITSFNFGYHSDKYSKKVLSDKKKAHIRAAKEGK